MNVQDIANYLGINPIKIRRYARKNFHRHERVWKFTDEEVKELLIVFGAHKQSHSST